MRRGHGSTKVPGVKLRPAAPTKSTKLGESSRQITRTQFSNTEDVDPIEILKSCKKPFVGVVICGSGLRDKINLFHQAVQLGAQTSSDLTDRVTHLICENPGSAKYNYCVEHGIPILQPSWITDAYDKWLSGEYVDAAKSTIHRFPTFKNVRLCLTGITEVDRRKQMRRQLERNGGTFVEALDKDTELTHLLCGPDRGEDGEEKSTTAKMQFVIKANKARAQKVHLVWEDWFWDCMEFKGILNEKNYLATGPRPPRRIRREPSPLLAPIASSAELGKQRTSSTISPLDTHADVEETANIKRVPEVTALLWENALRKRGFEMKDGKLTRSPGRSRVSSFLLDDDSQSSSPSASSRNPVPLARTKSSLNATFTRTKSFAAKSSEPEPLNSVFQRIRSTPAMAFKQSPLANASTSVLPKDDAQIPEGERNLFSGLRFRALGEASGPKLTEALELRGGTVANGPDHEVDFIIVRLVGGSTFYQNESDEAERGKYRTECWIEQCMFLERICAGEEHPGFVPLRITGPIPGADKLVVHISGLTPSEKTPSVRLLKALGTSVTDQLSRRNTHLICPCGSGPKFSKAQEWNIPILNLQWLFDTVKSGHIQDANNYLVDGSTPAAPATGICGAVGMMTDITNSEFVQGSSRNKISSKNSDKSQSSDLSSSATSHADIEPVFSESWTANALLSEPAPEHPPTSSPPGQSCHSPNTAPTTPSPVRRQTTPGEIALSRKPSVSPFTSPTKSRIMERVPSSATPSPLRMPSLNTRQMHAEVEGLTTAATMTTSGTMTASPTTTMAASAAAARSASTLSGGSANVLKDAIASLLGKRPSSDDASVSVPATNAEAESQNNNNGQQAAPGRAAKRSKPPPRTKSRQQVQVQVQGQDGSSASGSASGPNSARSFSRTTSLEVLTMGIGRTSSALSFDFALSSDGGINSPTDLLDRKTGNKAMSDIGEDESMRVTYEDPSQRAEERRLLSLISGTGEGLGDGMEVDGGSSKDGAGCAVVAEQQEGKKPQPRPRRRGRNLVRRVTNNHEQA